MYIQLTTENTPIDSTIAREFLSTIQRYGPQHIVIDTTKMDLDVPYTTTYDTVDEHTLRIHLSRNLTESEFDSICNGWDMNQVRYSTTISSPEILPDKNINGLSKITDQQYKDLALSLSKSHHAAWVKDKLDSGWRYGQYVSLIEKTHPLLMPWEQLPEKYKVPDLHAPQNIFNLLNNQGFSLVQTSELDAIVNLIKSIS